MASDIPVNTSVEAEDSYGTVIRDSETSSLV